MEGDGEEGDAKETPPSLYPQMNEPFAVEKQACTQSRTRRRRLRCTALMRPAPLQVFAYLNEGPAGKQSSENIAKFLEAIAVRRRPGPRRRLAHISPPALSCGCAAQPEACCDECSPPSRTCRSPYS